METVEKWLQPLIFLPFGLGINCGTQAQNIHIPVEKTTFPYIFASTTSDSCLDAMYMLHIFCPKERCGPKIAADASAFGINIHKPTACG